MAEPTSNAGPPIGLLPNKALFVTPAFYNLPGFGYADLNAQIQDAMRAYSSPNPFGGNNVPKYNGLPGSDPLGTFGGGFARLAPNVGGGLLGSAAYTPSFNPFAGRGNIPGGATTGPGAGGNNNNNNNNNAGGNNNNNNSGLLVTGGAGAGSGDWAAAKKTDYVAPKSNAYTGTNNQGLLGAGGVTGGGSTFNPGGVGNTPANYPTAGPPFPYQNNWNVPSGGGTVNVLGHEVPNPFNLTPAQIQLAMGGQNQALQLMEALGVPKDANGNYISSSPQMAIYHQIQNFYGQGGNNFTPPSLIAAVQNALNPPTPMQFPAGMPVYANMDEARRAGAA